MTAKSEARSLALGTLDASELKQLLGGWSPKTQLWTFTVQLTTAFEEVRRFIRSLNFQPLETTLLAGVQSSKRNSPGIETSHPRTQDAWSVFVVVRATAFTRWSHYICENKMAWKDKWLVQGAEVTVF